MGATGQQVANTEIVSARVAEPVWPRISLVTPVFNSGRYIEQTIQSVLTQGYPNLEYLIVDGGSTDCTLDIIRRYESQISGWVSEPDKGMYDAINKGFARSSGEIMGWISATDKLHTGGLFVVGSVFRDFPQVEWITGHPTSFEEYGMTAYIERLKRWSRYRFLAGANRYIQQESTLWRRNLWEKAGGYVDASRRMAGDFELWVRFFRHAQLYTVDALIGGFRLHSASLGLQHLQECDLIQREVVDAELDRADAPRSLRWLRRLHRTILRIPKIRNWWHSYFIATLHHAFYHWPASDWPPVIEFDKDHWIFRRR
jgi:glycosyltransferase involved in cell wall biosynthesis